MLFFETPREAKQAYLTHYNSPKFFGSMKEMDIDAFKEKFVKKNLEAAVPPVSPMMPGVVMGPPPIDVETLEGVEYLLGRIGGVNDKELIQIASEIWGPGFQYENVSPQQAREEIVGFLLDQRDLLFYAPQIPQPEQPQNEPQGSTDFSLLSQSSSSERVARSLEENSSAEELLSKALNGSSAGNTSSSADIMGSEATVSNNHFKPLDCV